MNRFTARLTALLIAVTVSVSVSAQNILEKRVPQPMDVSTYHGEIKHVSPLRQEPTRDYVTLLEEDFSLFTAGSEAEPDTVNLCIDHENGILDPNYFHEPGWFGQFVYQAGGCAYMGNWYYGFIDTPEFEMAGSVHFSFRARLQDGNQTMTFIGLCVDPMNPNIVDLQSCYITSEWQTFEFDLSNPNSCDAFIQINCYNEWFLDDLVVSRELNFTPAPIALEATDYTMEGFTANWSEVTTAESYLLTLFKRNYYGPEQVTVAPESFEGINNDGQWIDYDNPNFPEGWVINLQAGNQRHVTNDAIDGNLALCMDAEGDTIILPSNGGRYLESNISLKLLEYGGSGNSDLEIIAKINGNWHNTGVYYMASHVYENHGNEWLTDNMLSLWIGNTYDELGIAYTGAGVVWAVDYWDYTTSQACDVEYILTDHEIAAPAQSYILTGLDPAADHYYFLKARNAEFGESVESNYISCFGLCPPIVEQASGIGDGTYTANWQAHPKADGYEIHNYFVTTAETDQPNALVFSEDFVLVHNGLEPQNYMEEGIVGDHRLDEYTVQPDWTGRAVILAEGMLGGAMDDYYYGNVLSPQITLNNAETFHLKATIWGWEGAVLRIYATTTGEMHQVDFVEQGFQTVELDFTAGPESGRERVRFFSPYGYPFLIDIMQVTQDQHAGDKTFNILSWDLIGDGSTESFTYTGLDGYQWEGFAYDLIAIHNAFGDEYQSVNSDYVEVTVPLDVEENDEESKVSVYPNPAHDKFVISGEAQTIEVFDMTGRCVKSVQASALLTSVSTSSLANGLYLLKVTGNDGSVTNQRIVVEN